jgi:hypothetical protein
MADSIKTRLLALPAHARPTFKGEELAKVAQRGRTAVKDLELEITASRPIPGGVEVLARAWDGNGQLGFGKDGTVDIERFRFFNPPTQVHDAALDALQTIDGVERLVRGYREDPAAALLRAVLRSVRRTGKAGATITRGKIGRTVTTIYAEGADGVLRKYTNGGNWSTMRGAASADSEQTAPARCHNSRFGSDRYLDRFFLVFATNVLGSDEISAADLDLVTADAATGNRDVALVQHAQGDPADLVLGDYGGAGTTEGATRATCPASAGNAWGFTLNATGLAWIDGAGYTKLCLRGAKDLDNIDPGEENVFTHKASEIAGTSEDPALVVTHTASSAAGFLQPKKVW